MENMKDIISAEICKKCAECCKNHPFVTLSRAEIATLAKFTQWPVDQFANQKDESDRGHFLGFKENGHCIFLNKKNSGWSCQVYEARPEICRNYPSNAIQNEICHAKWGKIMAKGPRLKNEPEKKTP